MMLKSAIYKAIALRCLECFGEYPKGCTMDDCPIHRLRPGVRKSTSDGTLLSKFRIVNMLKSIRRECRLCTSGNPDDCCSPKCNFFPFRLGNSTHTRKQFEKAPGSN
jgi:hypothetical protein